MNFILMPFLNHTPKFELLYEDEYRLFVPLDTRHNGLYFMDYGDEMILK